MTSFNKIDGVTNIANWRETAELVGIAAIVGSLIFVGLQMRQDQRLAETQVFVDSEAVVVQLAGLFNENRDVWVRGLRNDELSESEESTFRILARALDRRRWLQFERSLRIETIPSQRYIEGYAYELYRFPGLKRLYMEHGEFLANRSAAIGRSSDNSGANFRRQVLDVLSKIEESGVPVDNTENYLF